MSQEDDGGAQREQISESAVYHELDDHLAPGQAPYDVDSGLQRLLGWMGEEAPPMRPSADEGHLSLSNKS
jgi:hypothetical protein